MANVTNAQDCRDVLGKPVIVEAHVGPGRKGQSVTKQLTFRPMDARFVVKVGNEELYHLHGIDKLTKVVQFYNTVNLKDY